MARRVDYRTLKKRLNKYHKFSFKMPPKGKDFTPQQKASITRQYNKLLNVAKEVESNKQSFIPYPKNNKLKLIDGVRTNKGIFYKYPGAQLVKLKTKKGRKQRYTVKTTFRKVRELFIPFDDWRLMDNIEDIVNFVNERGVRYKPDYIMWSVYGYKGRVRYEPELFELYAFELAMNPEFETKLEEKPFYNGVFFGWLPN